MKGFVREVFTSIQGEGLKVGQRMTFVRFLGCNVSCDYCDTTEAQAMEGPFLYEGKIFKNPIEVDFLLDKIEEQTVAITGGEPLLQVHFLGELCDRLRESRKSLYLDTNSSLPDNLQQVVDYFDTICLDFKVPSATGHPQLWQEHEQSLVIAAGRDVFVKIVINENFLPRELDTTCAIIARVDKSIPLVIQPVFGKDNPDLLGLQKKALDVLTDVRIIPQVHKYLHLR
ncbi:7-carboxy-7-deazaguanine synthase QueE [candidate division WOR-3 bacterium]|nr:7-carboxy-7-deazaguanine synthase QueE [candidate division WOR-3 bacterium]